jgi:hypothetical protein
MKNKKRGAPKKSADQSWHGTQKKRNFLISKDHNDFLEYKKAQGEKPSHFFRKLIEVNAEYQEWKQQNQT